MQVDADWCWMVWCLGHPVGNVTLSHARRVYKMCGPCRKEKLHSTKYYIPLKFLQRKYLRYWCAQCELVAYQTKLRLYLMHCPPHLVQISGSFFLYAKFLFPNSQNILVMIQSLQYVCIVQFSLSITSRYTWNILTWRHTNTEV